MKFGKYVLRRLLQMIPVILAIICICFFIIHLAPGDPATIMAGETASDEYIAELQAQFGLDQPMWKQLVIYIKNTLQGNLGESFLLKIPVKTLLAEKMKVTLVLVLLSEILAIALGTLLGMTAAKHENRIQDHIISNLSMVLYCMPTFWLGMMLMLLFSINLQWFPTSGMQSFNTTLSPFIDMLHHMFLPCLTLSLVRIPTYLKLGILFKHIVPNGMGPVLSNSILQMAQAVLTEASLSFLGLGDPNKASWGLILNAGQKHISSAPWLVIYPGIALALLLLAFNLIGTALHKTLNVKQSVME